MSQTQTTNKTTPVPGPPAGEPVLLLYDTLGPGHADGHSLARQIWALELAGHSRCHLRINSAGGSIAHGYSLFAALRHTRVEVHTWIDGLALSMAGLIWLAGRVRHTAPWGMLMLHNPSLAPAEGELPAEAGNAVLLSRVRSSVLAMYAGCTGLPPGRLSAMMEAETWLTASELCTLGLANGQASPATPEVELELRTRLGPVPGDNKADLAERISALRGAQASYLSTFPTARHYQAAGYTPLPVRPGSARRSDTIRNLERDAPEVLSHMRQADEEGFDRLYQAAYQPDVRGRP